MNSNNENNSKKSSQREHDFISLMENPVHNEKNIPLEKEVELYGINKKMVMWAASNGFRITEPLNWRFINNEWCLSQNDMKKLGINLDMTEKKLTYQIKAHK